MTVLIRCLLAFGLILATPTLGHAQTVGGVFGPTVNANEQEAELRMALVLDENTKQGTIARLHYQSAFDDRFRWRGVLQLADLPGRDFEVRHVQLELLWQTVKRTEGGYESGIRFDVRATPQDDRAERLGANWIHQWRFGEGWRVRAIARANVEVGPAANDGINLGFRSSLTRRLDNGVRYGLENFSRLGNTDSGLGRFGDQRHTVGPVVRGPLNDAWEWYTSVQVGLTERSDAQTWQFRLTRTF